MHYEINNIWSDTWIIRALPNCNNKSYFDNKLRGRYKEKYFEFLRLIVWPMCKSLLFYHLLSNYLNILHNDTPTKKETVVCMMTLCILHYRLKSYLPICSSKHGYENFIKNKYLCIQSEVLFFLKPEWVWQKFQELI